MKTLDHLFSETRTREGELGVGLDGFNILGPRQNGRHFADDIFKYIFVNENVWISIKISLNFVPTGPINNIPALVQIMAWRRPGDKPLSEAMMVNLLTHICVIRPQWVKKLPCYKGNPFCGDIKFVPAWLLFLWQCLITDCKFDWTKHHGNIVADFKQLSKWSLCYISLWVLWVGGRLIP